MNATRAPHVLEKLEQLRTELAELAFAMESRGRLDAADVAISVSARVAELCEELAEAGWQEVGAVILNRPEIDVSATQGR